MPNGEIGSRIKLARETFRGAGMKQGALAERLGVSQARLSNWERGMHEPEAEYINRIAEILEVSSKHLVFGDEDPKTPRVYAEPSGKIKIYGPISAGDGNTSFVDEAEIEVPVQLVQPDFGALIVEGDSMFPQLEPSDVVIFKDWKQGKVGSIMAAQLPDRSWVVKKLVYEGGTFRLRSLNAKYPDIEGPFQLAGFMVGLVRDMGPERLIRLNPYGLSLD